MHAIKSAFVFLLIIGYSNSFGQKKSALPPGFDLYVQKVLDSFLVPGVSIAIVKDGKPLLAKGYGLRKYGDTARVDANTLFLIASNTKAFTSTALAILVEEGKIEWDEPVRKYMPWFKMSDPYVSDNLTVRDLLVHHSGLPAQAGDMLYFPPSSFTRKELVEKLSIMPLVRGFRTTYAYDNVLYLAAGELIEAVTGITWEEFVQQRIFRQVGMTESISRFSDIRTKSNFAWSHQRKNNKPFVVEDFMSTATGDQADPAGGIMSCANDMSKWLITHLDSGRTASGQRLFQPATTRELWKVVRPMPVPRVSPAIAPSQQDFIGYALGFRNMNYGKYKLVYHGGFLRGYVSQVVMVPDLNLGISVLTNQQSAGAYWAIIYHVLDYYMQNKEFNWLGGYKKLLDSALARPERKDSLNWRNSKTPAPLPVSAYTGTFTNPMVGDIVINANENGPVLRFSNSYNYIADLKYFRDNNFAAVFRNAELDADSWVTYTINPDGKIDQLRISPMRGSSGFDSDPLIFKPVDRKIKDSAELRKAIMAELKRFPEGNFGIALQDLSSSKSFFYNETDSFHAASTMKTPVMIELFKQIEAGKFKLNGAVEVKNKFSSIVDGSFYSLDSIQDSEHDLYLRIGQQLPLNDLIFRMITKSSNLATNILIDLIGAKNVVATMRSMGAEQIQVRRGVEDSKAFQLGLNNRTNAKDLVTIFTHIANGTAVNKAACDSMISILMHQYFRERIPGKLPPDVKTATKSGSIVRVCHDSGIVFLPDGRKYVLVVLTSGIESEENAANLISNISKLCYDYVR